MPRDQVNQDGSEGFLVLVWVNVEGGEEDDAKRVLAYLGDESHATAGGGARVVGI